MYTYIKYIVCLHLVSIYIGVDAVKTHWLQGFVDLAQRPLGTDQLLSSDSFDLVRVGPC